MSGWGCSDLVTYAKITFCQDMSHGQLLSLENETRKIVRGSFFSLLPTPLRFKDSLGLTSPVLWQFSPVPCPCLEHRIIISLSISLHAGPPTKTVSSPEAGRASLKSSLIPWHQVHLCNTLESPGELYKILISGFHPQRLLFSWPYMAGNQKF